VIRLPPQGRGVLIAVLATLPALGGCVSTLSSVPATETARGLRYALPQPVLQVTPQADGTMAVEVLYLPDPNNTYAVTATSLLGGYTLEVKTKEGLLESVTFNPDSSGVAEQAINAYGDIRKGQIDAGAAAEKAATTKADEKAKAAEAAAQALADQKTAVDIAVAKRDKLLELRGQGVDIGDALTAAELAIVEAQQKLIALQSAAAAKAASASMNLAANAAAADQGKFEAAAGPVFYRLAPSRDGTGRVDLIADDVQVMGPTSKPVKPAPKTPDLSYSIVGPPVVRPGKNGLVLKIRVNQAVAEIVDAGVKLRPDKAGVAVRPVLVTPAIEDGATYAYVVFDPGQASGQYRLNIPVKLEAGGATVNPEAVRFVISK
jgi:hypothetical protein